MKVGWSIGCFGLEDTGSCHCDQKVLYLYLLLLFVVLYLESFSDFDSWKLLLIDGWAPLFQNSLDA